MAFKFNLPRLLAAAVAYVIIAQIIFTIGAMADMPYYTDPNYSNVWSKIMMPAAGPPPAEFYYVSVLFQVVYGFLFAFVYTVIKGAVPGKGWKNKGLMYGFLVFLVAGISDLGLVLLVNLPMVLVLSWVLQGLVVYLLAGLAAAKIVK